jgi:hypothetical protein
MGKRIWFLIAIFILIISTGCQPYATAIPQPTQSSLTLAQIATLSALSTQINNTPQVVLSPTLEQPSVTVGTLATPTNTPMPGTIVITGISQQSPDSALISWDVTGNFPSGFRVVWTDVQSAPTFPQNNSIAVGSSTARSAIINVSSGPIYYVRICRFVVDSCDIYSNLGIFAFSPVTSTPNQYTAYTATAAALYKTATAAASITPSITPTRTNTPVPSATAIGGTDSTLVINSIIDAGSGNAKITWTDSAGSSLGYKIVWSTASTTTPVYASGYYFSITNSAARLAYINGTGSTIYYYRICRATSSGCGAYSATYTYTYPAGPTATFTPTITPTPTATVDASTITITGISDTAIGSAQVNYNATGSFPAGFDILFSKTTALPTQADSVVVISDGSLRSGIISGEPSGTYHVRVCKIVSGACTIYSPTFDFTFAADTSTVSISSLKDNATTGYIDLTWTASGVFPSGFKLLYSTTQASPTFENASSINIPSGATRTGVVTGVVGTHYYLRVCKFTGSTCGVYSSVVEYTTAQTGIVLTVNPSDSTQYTWTLTPDTDNADGYRLFFVDGTIAPIWTTPGISSVVYDHADRAGTLPGLTVSGSHMVRLCFWNASLSTCGSYSKAIEVDIP